MADLKREPEGRVPIGLNRALLGGVFGFDALGLQATRVVVVVRNVAVKVGFGIDKAQCIIGGGRRIATATA